jgi:MFS family permease
LQQSIERNVRHNFIVNVVDGGFFGLAMGFASKVAVVPLFVASLTDSTVIIGLIGSLQDIGWQLPQLLTSNYVAGLRRYKRATLIMSIHERVPFIGLAIAAALLPVLGPQVTLMLTLLLLSWQALGGGLTATPWQSMISKIMPNNRRGTFYGSQSSAVALMGSIGVALAGLILVNVPAPMSYVICFVLASIGMAISFYFLALTREHESEFIERNHEDMRAFFVRLGDILRRDINVRWFVVARLLAQFAVMAVSFYTVYGLRHFNLDGGIIGVMASVLTLSQMVAAPLLGSLGDRWGHRRVFALGMSAATLSALIVALAPDFHWLYIAFALSGAANGVLWTTVMAFTCDFGTLEERPYYIGLTNTLVAPATIFAPLIGGWLADTLGFQATFLAATVSGLMSIAVLLFVLRNPADCVTPLPATAAAD